MTLRSAASSVTSQVARLKPSAATPSGAQSMHALPSCPTAPSTSARWALTNAFQPVYVAGNHFLGFRFIQDLV